MVTKCNEMKCNEISADIVLSYDIGAVLRYFVTLEMYFVTLRKNRIGNQNLGSVVQ